MFSSFLLPLLISDARCQLVVLTARGDHYVSLTKLGGGVGFIPSWMPEELALVSLLGPLLSWGLLPGEMKGSLGREGGDLGAQCLGGFPSLRSLNPVRAQVGLLG